MPPTYTAGGRTAQSADRYHGVRLRDGIVILDVALDSYAGFYLPAPASGILQDPTIMDALNERGLAGLLSADTIASPAWQGPAWLDCVPDDTARVRARDIAVFLGALLSASVSFHVRSFRTLVARARHRPAPGGSLAEYRSALARFERMALFLPFRMQCLFRSHFLLHVLRAHGLAANWVFGVSLFPFRAHCWIAIGDRLLGDRVDKVADFVPILVIANTTESAT